MVAKFDRRTERWTMVPAALVTFVEFVLTLVLVRFVFRSIMWLLGFVVRLGRGRASVAPVPLTKKAPGKVTEGA